MMITKILALLVIITAIASIGGAFATWKYAEESPLPDDTDVSVSVGVFDYPPEQILPGGDTTEATPGENHNQLIYLILWEDDKNYGLNINKNALIHQYLKSHEVVYSNQKISGGNLKFILDVRNNTYGLYYCIQKVSDTLYYAYTFSVDDLSTNGGTSNRIKVFRTTLEKINGEWDDTVAYEGWAKTIRLSSVGESADSHSLSYSIDVHDWRLNYE